MNIIDKLISIKIPLVILDSFIKELKKSNNLIPLKVLNKYELFRGKINNKDIIVYSSGKIVIPNNVEIQELIRNILEIFMPDNKSIIIGSDEVGKGEWLGPLVIGSVALNREQEIFLRSRGVMDSKDLSISRIKTLSNLIKKNSLAYNIILISPEKFNTLFEAFKEEGKSLNDLIAWGHAKSIKESFLKLTIKERSKLNLIVVDEFSKVITEIRIHRVLDENLFKIFQKPHAENLIPVAAASIIAKNERELWIAKMSKKIKLDLKKIPIKELIKRDDAFILGKIVYKLNKN
ncbi:MAG: hypothetical protein ACTSVV_05455 [Promethearchaeota archaeon]